METNIFPWVLFIGINVIISFVIFIFTLGGGYLVYKIANKFTSKNYSKIIVSIFPICIIYVIYRGFFPADEFYLNEFKDLMQGENVQDIKVIYGSATFPTFHPDYCSAALLRTTKIKYDYILLKIQHGNLFSQIDSMGSSAYDSVIKNTGIIDKQFIYKASNGFINNEYFFIGFLPENKMIIHKCIE